MSPIDRVIVSYQDEEHNVVGKFADFWKTEVASLSDAVAILNVIANSYNEIITEEMDPSAKQSSRNFLMNLHRAVQQLEEIAGEKK